MMLMMSTPAAGRSWETKWQRQKGLRCPDGEGDAIAASSAPSGIEPIDRQSWSANWRSVGPNWGPADEQGFERELQPWVRLLAGVVDRSEREDNSLSATQEGRPNPITTGALFDCPQIVERRYFLAPHLPLPQHWAIWVWCEASCVFGVALWLGDGTRVDADSTDAGKCGDAGGRNGLSQGRCDGPPFDRRLTISDLSFPAAAIQMSRCHGISPQICR